MKKQNFLLSLLVLFLFTYCKEKPPAIECPDGFTADSSGACNCPDGNFEVYGFCIPDDNKTYFGVSEGCPCDLEADTFLMQIRGHSQPDLEGKFSLFYSCYLPGQTYPTSTVLDCITTPFGYDSILSSTWPLRNSDCEIEGRKYWVKRARGRYYEGDSLVLELYYTNVDSFTHLNYEAGTKCNITIRN